MKRVLSLQAFLVGASLHSCATLEPEGERGDHDHAAEHVRVLEQADTACSGMTVPDSGPFNKRVALTFDDGPNPATTRKLLDILSQHDIQATFFIVGARVSSTEVLELLGEMRDLGHLIGNHTQNHKNAWDLTEEEFTSEVDGPTTILSKVVTPKFFRFPYGAGDCPTSDIVESYGYHITGWHNDSGDWCYAANNGYCSPSTWGGIPTQWRNDMVGYTLYQIKANEGGIVLFHDIHNYTVQTIETILNELEADGYTFVRADELDSFPLLNQAKPTWVGTACSSDLDCDFDDHAFCYQYGPSNARGFCSVPCEGYCEDLSGAPSTFCASVDGTGMCVAKKSPEDMSCGGITATIPTSAKRYVGTSGAPDAESTVCLPFSGVHEQGELSPGESWTYKTPTLPPGNYRIVAGRKAWLPFGDVDLYVGEDRVPTTTSYDCVSKGNAAQETCNIRLGYAKELNILVRGQASLLASSPFDLRIEETEKLQYY